MLKPIRKSAKLADVCYDIRGPVMARAKQMEEDGQRIIKLNIGNLAPFGFDAPDEVRQDVIHNLVNASGYSDSRGLFSARKAIMQYTQQKRIAGVGVDDIVIGNGVSELIVMSMKFNVAPSIRFSRAAFSNFVTTLRKSSECSLYSGSFETMNSAAALIALRSLAPLSMSSKSSSARPSIMF